MFVEMRALGIITLAMPPISGARAQAVFVTLLVGAKPITVVVVIRRLVNSRRVIMASTFTLMPMPISKASVSPSIKAATMIVMASPSIAIAVRPISVCLAIAGSTGRERAAL